MKCLLDFAFVISFACLQISAQRNPGSGTHSNPPARPKLTPPDRNPVAGTFLSGKVVVDDGSVPTDLIPIQTLCKGKRRTETQTDSHGNFSFQIGGLSATPSYAGLDSETSSADSHPGAPDHRDLRDCQVLASLGGFTSETIDLAGRFSGTESADIGRIVLHRLGKTEGSTISVTTAQAPDAAKKAFAEGQRQETQGKWDGAQKSFERAVGIYPKFAVAWFELGRVQMQKGDLSGAQHSFQQSIDADSKYASPYLGLTQIAMRLQNWREVADISDKLLALNPDGFPDAWLSNSAANYFLQNFDAAERSARHGLQVDPGHRVPKLEYVLGMILMRKPDYVEAAQHLRVYQSLATEPAEIAEAQKQLAEIARLTASANLAPNESK
jgi:tetratricopeptide (TPR) repeat protein